MPLRSSQFGLGAVGNYANTGTARAHLNNSLAVFLPCHLSYSLLATLSSPRHRDVLLPSRCER